MTKGIFTALFRNINLPFLASILLLAACSKDDNGQPLPDGQYPMTFTAAGIALNVETRATTDNNWQGVQTVAVLVDGEMKPYTVQADATDGYATATLTSDDPFYWQNTAPIQVSAWWPYTDGSTDMPAVVVQADQSEEDDFHKSDYICALDQTVEFGGTQDLQFTHRTAKVVVNPLVAGDDMTAEELAGATIALIGVTTGNEADGNTVTPYQNSIALLPQQQIAADEPFIRISLATGTTYSYKPDEAITLQAGYQYTYTITVNKTGLGMSNAAVTNWDKGAEIAGVAEPVIDFTLADDGSYIVYTAAGLLAWAAEAQKDLSLGCTLADDIDMSGQAWTPIGDCSDSMTPAYTGTFDGAGHIIRNLSITSQAFGVGLFGGIRGGTVKNLTLENPQISGNNYAGGIVAILQMNSSTIENCHVEGGSVTGGNSIGAIAGNASGMVRACSSSSVKVSGTSHAGGIGDGCIGGIVGLNNARTSNLYSCYAAEPLLTGDSGFGCPAEKFPE